MCAQLGDGLEKEVRSKLFTEYYLNAESEDGVKIRVSSRSVFCCRSNLLLLLLTNVQPLSVSLAFSPSCCDADEDCRWRWIRRDCPAFSGDDASSDHEAQRVSAQKIFWFLCSSNKKKCRVQRTEYTRTR